MNRKDELEEARRRRNADLAEKIRRGDRIEPVIPQEAMFYPPRPLIKKDARDMARIFGEDDA